MEDSLDLIWSVSGRLTMESFLGSPDSYGLGLSGGRAAGGKAPIDIWWVRAILWGMVPLNTVGPAIPDWASGGWGGPMEVEEARVDWGGLGAAAVANGCMPRLPMPPMPPPLLQSCGREVCEADNTRASCKE